MPVVRRRLATPVLGDLTALGAVRRRDGALLGFRPEVSASEVEAIPGEELVRLVHARGALLAIVRDGPVADMAAPAELDLLRGRNVLLTLRHGETAAATGDWLDWHRRYAGADAALIFDCAPPGSDPDFAEALAPLTGETDVLLVEGGVPTGPAGPEQWDGDFVAFALLELLRHGFCRDARAVAFLEIADLVLPQDGGTVFDRAATANAEAVALTGTEIFPWRLRKGEPAPHGDHVMVRAVEKWWHGGWCVAPRICPEEAVWHPQRIIGMAHDEARAVPFRRARGVALPGVPVARIVRKADLIEDKALADLLFRTFGRRAPVAPAHLRMAAVERPDERRVAIVTAMKNEGPFVLDWIAHNLALGVDRILVYTNDCTDGTDRILDLLADAGVTRRDNPCSVTGKVPQYAAFRAAESEEMVRDADWLLTLDVDEYLNIRAGEGRLADLFAAVPEAGAISMPWRLFGNADIHRFEDRPVVQQFELCAPEFSPRPLQAWAFKTLYRNDGTFGRLGVHRPKRFDAARAATLEWVDGAGRPLPTPHWRGGWRMTTDTWGYDLAGVNHYAVRSAESFLVKRDRGRVNHVNADQGLAYWFRMNHNLVHDRSLHRLDASVSEARARLHALPGVAEAHEAAVASHRDRIAALLADPEQAAFHAEITGSRMEKLSRLTPHFGYEVFYEGPDCIPDTVLARTPGEQFFFNV